MDIPQCGNLCSHFPATLILRKIDFSCFQLVKNCHFNNFVGCEFWFLGILHLKKCQKFKIQGWWNGQKSKWQFWSFWNQPKIISRKTREAGKLIIFHTLIYVDINNPKIRGCLYLGYCIIVISIYHLTANKQTLWRGDEGGLALWDESISRVGGHFSTMLKSKNAQMIVEWNCPKLGAMLMMNSCWLVNEFSIVLKRYLENNKKKCSQWVIFIESRKKFTFSNH